jgi:hypothetical protein
MPDQADWAIKVTAEGYAAAIARSRAAAHARLAATVAALRTPAGNRPS